ncbi:hypothetical protein EYF80_005888 [Liparis tanakae]|uniref:Uncharacterized protein n=1 Tax=Liparis tanakae TaxID=230148 RepID=A0A4Z2J1W5_9TELE|nr:hypothetical protein EYF80_005888 [Liparis tanakae]
MANEWRFVYKGMRGRGIQTVPQASGNTPGENKASPTTPVPAASAGSKREPFLSGQKDCGRVQTEHHLLCKRQLEGKSWDLTVDSKLHAPSSSRSDQFLDKALQQMLCFPGWNRGIPKCASEAFGSTFLYRESSLPWLIWGVCGKPLNSKPPSKKPTPLQVMVAMLNGTDCSEAKTEDSITLVQLPELSS